MRWIIVVAILSLGAATAWAATLIERTIRCQDTLLLDLDATGIHLYATCATYDANEQPVRNARQLDLAPRLTAQQRAGLTQIMQKFRDLASDEVGVPTPIATP